MFRQNPYKFVLLSLVGLALILAIALPAQAAPPSNDDIHNATVISAFPYSESLDTREADSAPEDPYPSCWGSREATVWYSVTPSQDTVVAVSTQGSSYNTSVSVYTGWPGYLSEIACSNYQNTVSFYATAGETYYIMVADQNTGGPYPPPYPYPPGGGFGGDLFITIDEVQPPTNDNFADAMAIPGLPFTNFRDTSPATRESGEPIPSCGRYSDPLTGTIWYAFTPGQDDSITASLPNTWFATVLAVYSGDTLGGLTEVGCATWGGPVTFKPVAGTTYHFQAGGMYGQSGQVEFHLELTPPPIAHFNFYPWDPSVFDNVQFYDNSYDPAGVGIQRQEWDFGDGSFATGCCPSHMYAEDGEYTVQLMVWTYDGRMGSVARTIEVETHDVAITRFKVPNAASAGQTRQIVVGVNNRRYDETVYVDLYKSGPGGYFEYVGTLNQYVPVRRSNRTTDFKFTYTFTPEDANLGKVTFRAVAWLQSHRDALPADNEARSLPTKVNP